MGSCITNDSDRDLWVLTDQDGQHALYRLVEVEAPGDVVRLTREPTVVIDVAMPRVKEFESAPGAPRGPIRRRGPIRPRLILLKLHTVGDGDASGLVAYKGCAGEHIPIFGSRTPQPLPLRTRVKTTESGTLIRFTGARVNARSPHHVSASARIPHFKCQNQFS
jgi:hypothetical protein